MDAVQTDLRYRVYKIRLWGEEFFDGCQFCYRHFITNEEVEGKPVTSFRVGRGESRLLEIDLNEFECIDGVEGREDNCTNAVELVTSAGRRFRVGGLSGHEFTRQIDGNCEVRGLHLRLRSWTRDIERVEPILVSFPSIETLQLVTQLTKSAYTTSKVQKFDCSHAASGLSKMSKALPRIEFLWVLPPGSVYSLMMREAFQNLALYTNRTYTKSKGLKFDCSWIASELSNVSSKIMAIHARGSIYPVAALVEFEDIARQLIATFQACRHRLTLFCKMRRRSNTIIELVSRLSSLKSAVDCLAGAELACLNLTRDSVWNMNNVRSVVALAVEAEQFTAVAHLLANHAESLSGVFDEVSSDVVRYLIRQGDLGYLRKMIRTRSLLVNKTVPQVMDAYEPLKPIQMAVRHERLAVLEWLVTECHINPFEKRIDIASNDEGEAQGDLPALEFILDARIINEYHDSLDQISSDQLIVEYDDAQDVMDLLCEVMNLDIRERMSCLLTQIKHRQEFQTGTLILTAQSCSVSQQQLLDLVPKMTTVYDLGPLYTFGKIHLTQSDFKTLLLRACDHIIANKLVLDINAAIFFKAALKRVHKCGLLPRFEYENYKLRNVQVNMEGVDWVLEIKKSIQKLQFQVSHIEEQLQTLQHNVKNLRDALIQKEAEEARRKRCEQIVSLISMALFAIGGPVFKALQDALNLAEPLNLFFATINISEGDVGKWLADKTAEYIFHDGVERVLNDACVDPVEFADILRDTVILDHPELMDKDLAIDDDDLVSTTDTFSTTVAASEANKSAVEDTCNRLETPSD